jgi:hypothetical protein
MNEGQMFNGLARTAAASQMAQMMALLLCLCAIQDSRWAETPVFSESSLQGNASRLCRQLRTLDSIHRDCEPVSTVQRQ